MGVSVSTVQALESGSPGVCIGSLAMALLTLGILSRLDDLTDLARDDIGLLLEIESLPKRVRRRERGGPRKFSDALIVEPSSKGALL